MQSIFVKNIINIFIFYQFIFKRIILAFDLIIWYLRLLRVSIIYETIGPKLIMIQEMVYLVFFNKMNILNLFNQT